jgi:hypothetical protein
MLCILLLACCPEGFPEVARDLVERLLQLEPDERLGGLGYCCCFHRVRLMFRALLHALHLAACLLWY